MLENLRVIVKASKTNMEFLHITHRNLTPRGQMGESTFEARLIWSGSQTQKERWSNGCLITLGAIQTLVR